MSKASAKYEIKTAARGSFIGARGRMRYALEAGIVSERDIDPAVLARLIAAGVAARLPKASTTVTTEEIA